MVFYCTSPFPVLVQCDYTITADYNDMNSAERRCMLSQIKDTFTVTDTEADTDTDTDKMGT